MIARQVPDDADRPEVILAPQVQHLFDDFGRCLVRMRSGDRLPGDEPGFAMLKVGLPPEVEV